MKKYQIYEVYPNNYNAGTKAVQDAAIIASQKGYLKQNIYISNTSKNIFLKIIKHINFFWCWERLYYKVKKDSIVFIQHPLKIETINTLRIIKKLKIKKNVQFITLIHDINELRSGGLSKDFSEKTSIVFQLSDFLISHNKKMTSYLISKGIKSHKIIELNIFDYLYSDKNIMNSRPKFSKKINIAGNLDPEKAAYINQLPLLKELTFNLYGANYTFTNQADNIVYKGSFTPEELRKKLNSGFGLVWDGDTIETCDGFFGSYLRFNNPHKLSLYLGIGLPVIIWSDSAEADFVLKNKVGIVVSSLKELETLLPLITKEEYEEFSLNAQNISKKIKSGYYLKTALDVAETNSK